MVDVRSDKKEVKVERRKHPRLELHCNATIPGLKGIQTLTDISFGGCFIEAKIAGKVKLGQTITLNTKLPTERNEIKVKAKIVSQRERGIGCQFISLQDDARDAICTCFELYKDTLPAGGQESQWKNECLETEPKISPSEPKKDIKQPPIPAISELNQIKRLRSKSQPGILLKVGVGLAVVLLAGYLLTKIILPTSPKPELESNSHDTAVAIPQSHPIKIQAKSIEQNDDNHEREVQNVQTFQIEEENAPIQDSGLTQGKSVVQTEAEPTEGGANPLVSEEETPDVALKKTPDQKSSDIDDRKPVPSEPETTASIPLKELYSIEIGPFFKDRELKEATGILRANGLDPVKKSEIGTVKVIRLFEGSYTRDVAQERLKEIQKVVDSAFVLPEKGKLSIYVATYHNHEKAIEKSKQLEKLNIKVTAVPTDIKMKVTKLVVKQVEQQNIADVQDQMSKLGFSVKILKSG